MQLRPVSQGTCEEVNSKRLAHCAAIESYLPRSLVSPSMKRGVGLDNLLAANLFTRITKEISKEINQESLLVLPYKGHLLYQLGGIWLQVTESPRKRGLNLGDIRFL